MNVHQEVNVSGLVARLHGIAGLKFSGDGVEEVGQPDTGTLARLRRVLAFDLGTVILSEVEHFLPVSDKWECRDEPDWQQQAAYLVAGLFAQHYQYIQHNEKTHGLGESFARFYLERTKEKGESKSLEKRFFDLLRADESRVAYHMRQMFSLLKTENTSANWKRLLTDLLAWNHPDQPIQRCWAREYHRTIFTNENR